MALRNTIILIISLASCIAYTSCKNEENKSRTIARVYDNYLYVDDIAAIIPKKTKASDSAAIAQKFINSWVHDMLILHKAEQNLNDEEKNVDKQLRDYRNSLITFAFEKELVSQKLDTVVSNEAIEKYYNEHPQNFELKDNIIKVIYVKVNKKAPNITKLKIWYRSENPKDKEQLENYCHEYAENFYTNDNTWLLFDDLLKEIPIQPSYNKELFLQNNRFIEVADSSSLYFLNIKGFKIKNSLSPLAFEKENIRKIITNKRKLDLINKMKEDVYKEAEEKKDFEIFDAQKK